MKLWAYVCAFALVAILSGCASAPLQIDGPILQTGRPDAPIYESELETRGTCEMFLRNFSWLQQKVSRCVARLSMLPYYFDMQVEVFGKLRMYTDTLETCQSRRKEALSNSSMRVLSECTKTEGAKK